MSLKDLCANTYFINEHLARQDEADREFEVIYSHAVNLFKHQLESNIVKEDIESDLNFEISVEIDCLSYNININDIAKRIYDDFDIKGVQ